jgi:hypothetical protein
MLFWVPETVQRQFGGRVTQLGYVGMGCCDTCVDSTGRNQKSRIGKDLRQGSEGKPGGQS